METEFNVKERLLNYDEMFLNRYDSIYKWGMVITKYNHELAEDLIHDVYVRFIATHRNLIDINSFDDYFYVALRNSYISYLRRTTQQRQKQHEVIEFDLADKALLATDVQYQFEVREILRAICQYACLRKATSISASVLILRFFHGYFPQDIARIIKSTRNAVEVHLVLARREAIAYLANPDALPFIVRNQVFNQTGKDRFRNYHGTMEDLLNMIFAAREGDCPEPAQLGKIYYVAESRVTRNALSHIVSCPFCLGVINKSLGLSP